MQQQELNGMSIRHWKYTKSSLVIWLSKITQLTSITNSRNAPITALSEFLLKLNSNTVEIVNSICSRVLNNLTEDRTPPERSDLPTDTIMQLLKCCSKNLYFQNENMMETCRVLTLANQFEKELWSQQPLNDNYGYVTLVKSFDYFNSFHQGVRRKSEHFILRCRNHEEWGKSTANALQKIYILWKICTSISNWNHAKSSI